MSDKSGKGVFVPRAFTFTGVDGKEYTWIGRGRYTRELTVALEAEQAKGVSTLADALADHKKNKPTGNPVGRPKGSVSKGVSKEELKVAAADIVSEAELFE